MCLFFLVIFIVVAFIIIIIIHTRDQQWEQPFVTAVGSPNFGVRSFERDLEVQFVLQSRCPTLRASLCRESQRLYKHAALVTAATWQRPERLLNGGWTWANGGWIKWGWRVFSRFL